MPTTAEQLLVHEQLAPGVRAFRFVKPDLRRQLDPIIGDDNTLYREIVGVLNEMGNGDKVIFNFGLVERFPTSFFQLMMKVRQHVLTKEGHVYLCCFRDEIRPTVELMGGARLFQLTATEDAALHEAKGK
jgi:anti-anti-sigma regulatory factor